MSANDGPRERLINTASKLFYQQGYQATGINQLIQDASVAKASFYDHFKDKEELYLAFLEKRHEDWGGALDQRVSREKTNAAKIKAVFRYLEDWMQKDKFRGCAFLNSAAEFSDSNSRIRSAVSKTKNSLRTYIRELVQAHAAEQSVTKAEANNLADEVYVLVEGAIITSQVYGEPWPIRRAAKSAAKLLDLP